MKPLLSLFQAIIAASLIIVGTSACKSKHHHQPKPARPIPLAPSFSKSKLPLKVAGEETSQTVVWEDCINKFNNCSTNNILPLGAVTPIPTADDILKRTFVTHDWMATRFREYLKAAPNEIFLLMRAAAGVVIAADIRPSHFEETTQSLYLDAADFCSTAEECETVPKTPDPRLANGAQFSFETTRQFSGIGPYRTEFFKITDLLMHELVHANDALPPSRLSSLSRLHGDLFMAVRSLGPRVNSSFLRPTSEFMKRYAMTRYAMGNLPNFLPTANIDQIVAAFSNDFAAHPYSYYSPREDVAMNCEQVLLKYTLGVETDVILVSKEDRTILWGERNRVAEPSIAPRALAMIQAILPEINVDAVRSSLGTPSFLERGTKVTKK